MHQGEIHIFPEIAERFRRRHTHFPGNSRTVPKSTKGTLGCLHVDLLISPGVLAGRGWGPMSCAAPGPALALDATVSYCCWVHIKSRIKLQAWVLFCGAFTALVEYGLLKFISKIMTENSVFSRLFYSC